MRPHTRRVNGIIGRLPYTVRTEINRKIRDGWTYGTIAQWLFAQKAEQAIPDLGLEEGDLYLQVWLRRSKSAVRAQVRLEYCLGRWFKTHYLEWLRHEVSQDKSIRVLKEMDELSRAANESGEPESKEGGNRLIRSLLLDTIKLLHEENADPAELAQLANAWARLNQTSTENEKLKLLTEKSIDAGLEALKAEITKDPETVALFKKLHDIVKGSRKPTA
jgi:hypothetical protein